MPTAQEVVIGQEVPEAQVQAREEVIHVPRIIQQERSHKAHVEAPAQVPVSMLQVEDAHVPEIIVQNRSSTRLSIKGAGTQVIQQTRVQHQQVEHLCSKGHAADACPDSAGKSGCAFTCANDSRRSCSCSEGHATGANQHQHIE